MKYLLGDNIQPFKSYLNFLTFCLSIQKVKICFSIKNHNYMHEVNQATSTFTGKIWYKTPPI